MAKAGAGAAANDSPTVYGGPTKRFFVSMLTRDIDLGDAILDLIDNSVDGAMRQRKGKLHEDQTFNGFGAEITLNKKLFRISDNCGGIPKDYVEDAFSLGRPNIQKDSDLPTIGMYGIGMKRAIFKIGDSASVASNSDDGFFSVSYSSDWLDPENDEWDLPIERKAPNKKALEGVTITIDQVKADIGASFSNDSFVNALKGDITEHFGYLMQRGFAVSVNGEQLKPRTLIVFSGEHSDKQDIRAFDFEAAHDDVNIKVTIGLFRGLAKEAEIDDETESPKDTETAGVSVVCNDRVILLADRTLKTGWGDGTVPRYHPQFRAIAGLIIFSSNNASKLPISTTKRGLDVGSDVYLLARKAAMEGLKTFTDFTNRWKGMEDDTTDFFTANKRTDVKTGVTLARAHGSAIRGIEGARKYIPALPVPANRNPRKRVSFVRDEDAIRRVSKYLFEDAAVHPSVVGAECFDRTLAEAGKK
jgi:hypothetical protein